MPSLPSSLDCSTSYGLLNGSAHMLFDAGRSIMVSQVTLVVKDHGAVPQYKVTARDLYANAKLCSYEYTRVDAG